MAAASPVIISSSPPPSVRYASITPPPAPRAPNTTSSSSPRLPSPSAFVPRRTTALKLGSRAQPAPEGARLGFVSAGSLWRDRAVEPKEGNTETFYEDLTKTSPTIDHAERSETVTESIGKLKEPRKSSHWTKAKDRVHAADVEREDVCEVTAEATTVSEIPSVQANAASQHEAEANVDLLAAAPPAIDETIVAKPNRKSRKKSEQPSTIKDGSGAKKPGRPRPKSEAIILDSDEPEPNLLEDAGAQITGAESSKCKAPLKKGRATPMRRGKRGLKAANPRPSGTDCAVRETVPIEQVADHEDAPQRSVYFSKGPASIDIEQPMKDQLPTLSNKSPRLDTIEHGKTEQTSEVAVRRRRSWTPVKDTDKASVQISRPPTAGSDVSGFDVSPKLNLAMVLSGYGYTSADREPAPSEIRTPSGEALMKRRRSELVETPAAEIAPLVDRKSANSKKAPRAKAPKKKPQTITALATAAFLPQKEADTPSHVVSTYFASGNASHGATKLSVADLTEPTAVATKVKKPRKARRIKVIDSKDDSERPVAARNSKKATNPKKKSTVKFNESNYLPKLYSPSRAVAQIQNQQFLFGTSSQLAPAESADFIRDLQTALQASEPQQPLAEGFSSPNLVSSHRIASPQKSRIKVPTAPHGTSMSIEQGTRDLWSVASRDFRGGLLAFERGSLSGHINPEGDEERETTKQLPFIETKEPAVVEAPDATHTIIEVNTSPIADPGAQEHPAVVDLGFATTPIRLDRFSTGEDDSWMILHSDRSESINPQRYDAPESIGTGRVSAVRPPSTTTTHATASPFRTALRPLDSNLRFTTQDMSHKSMAFDQARAFNSTSKNPSRNSVPPQARLEKTTAAKDDVESPPRKRGRPSKAATVARDSSPTLPKLKRSRTVISELQTTSQADWVNIDEISDSDSPATPSPPRRRATSSPPEVPRLILSPLGAQSNVAEMLTHSNGVTLKPDGLQWSGIKTALFSRITECLKSAPRDADAMSLSWWEKILLYDPIIVEDLTTWLNGQGLCVQVARKKNAAGKTNKKRKADAEQPTALGSDLEIREEPLQPWMVQKWCEENSICCYLKKGSWRGGRARNQ